jgi:glycosyltransferase involved in cell wall biosynthesis
MTNVAVIVAAFDASSTLDEALASVAAQTTSAAEVIVADDASTDDTASRARAWVDRLPVKVVGLRTNAGPAAARAAAIAASASPLIALLDADDVWLPDHLATLAAAFRPPGDVVMADLLFWVPGEDGGRRWSDIYAVPPADQLAALYRANFVNSCTLFARSLYDSVGGFRAPLRVGEDWDLWIRMLRRGASIVATDHPTVRYRMKPMGGGGFADRRRVLALAAAEATTVQERRAIRGGMRLLDAEAHLFAAYDAAPARPWRARAEAARALRGSKRVAARGAAMLIAPRRVAQERHARHADVRSRLRG